MNNMKNVPVFSLSEAADKYYRFKDLYETNANLLSKLAIYYHCVVVSRTNEVQITKLCNGRSAESYDLPRTFLSNATADEMRTEIKHIRNVLGLKAKDSATVEMSIMCKFTHTDIYLDYETAVNAIENIEMFCKLMQPYDCILNCSHPDSIRVEKLSICEDFAGNLYVPFDNIEDIGYEESVKAVVKELVKDFGLITLLSAEHLPYAPVLPKGRVWFTY